MMKKKQKVKYPWLREFAQHNPNLRAEYLIMKFVWKFSDCHNLQSSFPSFSG